MRLHLRLDELRDPRVFQFLQAHLADMRRASPPESVHALDVQALRRPEIRLWSAWLHVHDEPCLIGTVALKHLSAEHVELKSMRTAEAMRGQGLGRMLLVHAMAQARQAGHARISLETGTQAFFEPAHRLYLAHGFQDCAPFADYRPDPNSRFMSRAL